MAHYDWSDLENLPIGEIRSICESFDLNFGKTSSRSTLIRKVLGHQIRELYMTHLKWKDVSKIIKPLLKNKVSLVVIEARVKKHARLKPGDVGKR